MTDTTTSQQNIEAVPVPGDLILPAPLAERLNRLPHETNWLTTDDIIFVLPRGPASDEPEFTRKDIEWCTDRAWLALSYAAQLEAAI